jgi:hypothetical protein
MAISRKTLISTAEGGEPPKKPRVLKKDRDFCPPELGLRPSRYRLAERLYEHYARCRQDQEYADRYERFVHTETIARIKKASEFADYRDKGKDTYVAKTRVRASEIKSCARQTTMRLMGFTPALVGADSPWWNLAALSGTELHEQIEIALKYLGVSSRSEFSLTTEDGTFSGRVDHELDGAAFESELEENAVPAIVDVKTVNEKDFKEGCWGKKIPGYIAQISPYCLLTNRTIGVVLLVDRGTGRLMDFEWTVDKAYAERMLLRANKIVAKVQARKLPKPEAFENGKPVFECWNFCPFARQCMTQEEDGSIQFKLDQGADPKEL